MTKDNWEEDETVQVSAQVGIEAPFAYARIQEPYASPGRRAAQRRAQASQAGEPRKAGTRCRREAPGAGAAPRGRWSGRAGTDPLRRLGAQGHLCRLLTRRITANKSV